MKSTSIIHLAKGCLLVAIAIASSAPVDAASVVLQSFNGLGFTGDDPPDMGGAVGGNYVMQIINGAVRITTTTGTTAQAAISDSAFWLNAGVSNAVVGKGLSDPRVIYDPASKRFFVSEINVDQTANSGNKVLLAVSNTSDPTQGFKGVSIAGFGTGSAPLADFPTLGVDQTSIYVGTNNFPNDTTFSGVSLFAIPKAGFIASQNLSNMTRFDNLNADNVGFTLQGATSTSATSKILAIDNITFGTVDLTSVMGAGSAGATLGATTKLTGILDGNPNGQRQPDGSRTLDGGDDRFGSIVYEAGGYIYAVNTIGNSNNISTHDSVHWMILNSATNALVAQGQITNSNYDYTYASIAANANGDFLIAYNRSGPAADGLIRDYGEVCHFNSGTNAVTCETPLLLQTSATSYTQTYQRWGDYSAAQVDPNNPNDFWAFQEYAPTADTWATQITEIGPVNVATPEPGTTALMFLSASGIFALLRKRGLQ